MTTLVTCLVIGLFALSIIGIILLIITVKELREILFFTIVGTISLMCSSFIIILSACGLGWLILQLLNYFKVVQ
jgi:hypothetical protein